MGTTLSIKIAAGLQILLFLTSGAVAVEAPDTGLGPSIPSERADYGAGVNLTMPPEEMAKIMFVHPNETKSANITVRNTGGLNDTVSLNMTIDFHEHAGWNVWLSQDELVLGPNKTRNAAVIVRGPAQGQPNEYIDVGVNATSMNDPSKVSGAEFRVYLVVYHCISLKCPSHVHTVSWGGTQYALEVHNLGEIAEDIALVTSGPPCWEYYLDRDNATVPPGESVFVTLTVIPPVDSMCDEVGVVTVTAYCVKAPSVNDSIATHTVACICSFLRVVPDRSEDFVDPGNSTQFTLSISFSGNMAGDMPISLSIDMSSPDWTASLDLSNVSVSGGESRQVNLTVTAPKNAAAGSRLVVRMIGRYSEWNLSDSCTVTVIVRHVQSLDITIDPYMADAYPGQNVTYCITVANAGNANEEVWPVLKALPEGWMAIFSWPNGCVIGPGDFQCLEPGASIDFRATLATAAGCLCGNHMVEGYVQFRDGHSIPFGLTVRISQIYDINLSSPLSGRIGAPGVWVRYDIHCTNLGNGPDNVSLSLMGLPAGWPEPLFKARRNGTAGHVYLGPFEQQCITVEVAIPSGTPFRTLNLTMAAISSGGASDSVQLTLDILLPNLYITNMSCSPKNPTVNRLALITLTVGNSGEMEVENVTVRFYIGKQVMGEDRLERMPAGSNLFVTFTWYAQWGRHTLKFVVDPDNMISETDKKDNTAKDVIGVGTPIRDPLGSPSFGLPLLAFALVWVCAIMSMRRKKRVS